MVHLAPVRRAVACPVCGTRRQRVPSRDHRQPWEVAWGQWPVPLIVQARRFFCEVPTWLRQIFVGPFPREVARYARQTERLRQVLGDSAHASSAEMGARLARWLGEMVSPDPLIRLQRHARFALPAPRILGVDAVARRRGVTYGTLLVDLARRQPVAVLEGRTAEPVIKWLQEHPSVTILGRDRAGA